MSSFKEGWYVIYTRPNHEKKVHTRLAGVNINSFLPLKKKLQVGRKQKKFVDVPLFPSYIFTFLPDMSTYYNAIEMEGCLYYVRSGREIARVNESVINNIRIVVNQAKEIEVSESRFQPGRKVFISQGPLAGLSCEVVQSDNIEKLLVRITLMQRNILINMHQDNLIAVDNQ